MDTVIHLSEGHRSDMLLDLSGLAREERVMVQASISDESDFDRVAEVLIIQHPRIHFRESQRRTKGKGQRQRRIQNVSTIQTLVGFAEKAKANTLAAENLERVPNTQTSLPLKIRIILMKTWMNPQTPSKPTMTQLTLEATTEQKLRTMMMMRNTTRFLRMFLWAMLCIHDL